MNLNPKLVLVAVILATVLIAGLSVAVRGARGTATKAKVQTLPGAGKATKVAKHPVFVPAKKAPQEQVARSMEDARVRSTYQNFRSAVAVGNAPLQKALRDVLKRDEEVALQLAREDVNRSTEAGDREIAEKALLALSQ